jgi:hypothetical protein
MLLCWVTLFAQETEASVKRGLRAALDITSKGMDRTKEEGQFQLCIGPQERSCHFQVGFHWQLTQFRSGAVAH